MSSAQFETGAVSVASTLANNESYIEEQTLTFQVGPAGDLTSYSVAVADNASAADIASSITANVANVSATAQTVLQITDGATLAGTSADIDVNGVTLSGLDTSSIANFAAAFETAVESNSALSNLTVNVPASTDN